MTSNRESLVQEKIGDLTSCSICTEIFTDPRILPCVHTFCLQCLESYGKDKKPGNDIACPICRSNVTIPTGGLCNLPHNFFIKEMVEIGKLAVKPVNEAKCNICPEGEELVANMYCVDCEQILCERCYKSHKKTKFSQHHQVVELGRRLNVKEFNSRNSYCEHHPKELIKMFCHEDNVAICLICCVESHQSHSCVNVDRASGEFTERLKQDLQKVTNRLPECEYVEQRLDKHKKEFLKQISDTEESIRNTGAKLKMQIDQHTEILVQKLKLLKEQNLKVFEIAKQDVDRFRVMISSFSRYCEELLSNGSPVNICRAADQMHTRANDLEIHTTDCSKGLFHCDSVVFHSSGFDDFVRHCKSNNAVGDLTVAESQVEAMKFEPEISDELCSKISKTANIQIRVEEGWNIHVVTLHPNATVDELFRIVCTEIYAEDMRPEELALGFEDKVLEYNKKKTLQDCEIVHRSTVTVLTYLFG